MTDQLAFDGLVLVGTDRDSFADFYRERVRHSPGNRLAVAQLRREYETWCQEMGVSPASQKQVRRFMGANGHQHAKSSVMYYADAILGDFADVPLPRRSLPVLDATSMREAINVMRADLGALVADLQSMDRRLARLLPNGRRQ